MAFLLNELEQIIRKSEGGLTIQEANVLLQLRAYCVRDFTLGLAGGSVVTWFACHKLPNIFRLSLTAGVAYLSGLWRYQKASENITQHVLSLEGTRMQKELGTLMLKKYQDDPQIMQRVSKYFYSEEVYNDASDRPRLRWRYRNFFSDSYSQASNQNRTDVKTSDHKRADPERINEEGKQEQLQINAVDAMENPFDCIFGIPGSVDEIPHSGSCNKSSTRNVHGSKRGHRRHRKRQQEAADHA